MLTYPTTTLGEEWEKFEESDVPKSVPDEVVKALRNAFFSGAQACLVLTAEAMVRFRDEINGELP